MKLANAILASVAVLASAACNAEKKPASDDTVAAAKPVPPPANGDWTQVVTATPEGGFMMGNPTAKVKLVEYGSLTCPHCKAFEEEGVPNLLANYVKPGKVSYEFRNYVRDPYDIAASLITRCNGEQSFFPLTVAMYKDQADWIGKLQQVGPAQQQSLESMSPQTEFMTIAKWAGFQQWAAMRGIPTAKSTQCLTDQSKIDQLVQMNSDATDQYDIPGTPTFLINGKVVDKAATWETLEPNLKSAIGG